MKIENGTFKMSISRYGDPKASCAMVAVDDRFRENLIKLEFTLTRDEMAKIQCTIEAAASRALGEIVAKSSNEGDSNA